MDRPYVTGDWGGKYNSWKKEREKRTYKALPTLKNLPEVPKKPAHTLEGRQSDIEIPSNSVTLQSGISNRHSRTKGDTINGNVYIKTSRLVVFLIGIIIVLIILGGIFYLNYNPNKIRYKYIDIEPKNVSGLPMIVYYNGKQLFYFSGWESMLTLNETDRLFGNEQYKKIIFDDNGRAYTQITLDDQVRIESLNTDPKKATKIGWFTFSNDIKMQNKLNKNDKEVLVSLTNDKLSSNIGYKILKDKPYFSVEYSADSGYFPEIGDFALGFVTSKMNVYLPNGTILVNDNNVTQINNELKIVIVGNVSEEVNKSLIDKIPKEVVTRRVTDRRGSYYKIKDNEYEIFFKDGKGFIVFSDEGLNDYENLFQWNVHRIYVSSLNKIYSKAYFIILDNASLNYDLEVNDWEISDKYFNGYTEDYINSVQEELWNLD